MRINDRDVDWKRHKTYIPINQFQNGSAAPNVYPTEVTSRKMLGHDFDGSGGIQSVGGVVEGSLIVPAWWNPEWPLGFRVWWTSASATAGDGVTWVVLANRLSQGGAILTAATGALDTVIVEDALVAQYGIHRSARGIRNAPWASRAQVDDGSMLQFSVELDATDATLASESVWLLGIEIDYTPFMTVFPHSDRDASDGDTLR